jgi:hypothetical protein
MNTINLIILSHSINLMTLNWFIQFTSCNCSIYYRIYCPLKKVRGVSFFFSYPNDFIIVVFQGLGLLASSGSEFSWNLWIYWTVGRDRPDARPLPTHRTTQHRKTRTHILPLVGFEPTIPVFERPNTVHTSDHSTTGTDPNDFIMPQISVQMTCNITCPPVGIATGYGMDVRMIGVRLPAGAGNYPLHHRIQTGSGAHPASFPIGSGSSFPGGKTAGAWSSPLTSTYCRGQRKYSYNSTPPPPYVFMACCLVKHRDNFTFTLTWSAVVVKWENSCNTVTFPNCKRINKRP